MQTKVICFYLLIFTFACSNTTEKSSSDLPPETAIPTTNITTDTKTKKNEGTEKAISPKTEPDLQPEFSWDDLREYEGKTMDELKVGHPEIWATLESRLGENFDQEVRVNLIQKPFKV